MGFQPGAFQSNAFQQGVPLAITFVGFSSATGTVVSLPGSTQAGAA